MLMLVARWSFVVLILVVCRGAVWADEPEIRPPFNASTRTPEADAALEKALDEPVTYQFGQQPLMSLVEWLAQYNVHAALDTKALEDAGIGRDTPLPKLDVQQIALRSALSLLLGNFDCTPLVYNGKLLITTADKAETELSTLVYAVDDLVRTKGGKDYEGLIEVITSQVRPATWDEVGGPGSVSALQGTLSISQTADVHREIQALLAALRASRAPEGPSKPIWAVDARQRAAFERFDSGGGKLVDFKFEETPLEKAVQALADAYALPIVLDVKSLEDAGIGPDTPVTMNLRQVSLPVAFDLMLRDMDLTHILKNELIQVTTKDKADTELIAVVYPVGDIVGTEKPDFDSLIELITTTVRPQTWDEVGGPSSVGSFMPTTSLVISQTESTHREIAQLLTGIRQQRAAGTPAEEKQVARKSELSFSRIYRLPEGRHLRTGHEGGAGDRAGNLVAGRAYHSGRRQGAGHSHQPGRSPADCRAVRRPKKSRHGAGHGDVLSEVGTVKRGWHCLLAKQCSCPRFAATRIGEGKGIPVRFTCKATWFFQRVPNGEKWGAMLTFREHACEAQAWHPSDFGKEANEANELPDGL